MLWDKEGLSCCTASCQLPTPLGWALVGSWPLLATRILTWVWDLKPRGYQKHTLPGISSSIEAILRAIRREDICYCEDEAEQPGHKDGQDDLKWLKEKALSGQQKWWLLAKDAFLQSEYHTPEPIIISTLQKKHIRDLLRTYSLNGITFRESSFMQWSYLAESG